MPGDEDRAAGRLDSVDGLQPTRANPQPLTLHLCCRVIDNFGDAGASWRLARQLAREHGLAVTLFIDRPEVLARLVPGLALADRNAWAAGELRIRTWPRDDDAGAAARDEPLPDVLVCAYGCDPPAALRARLAGAPVRPLWIELDYLSAEAWVGDFHGLPSLKPADGARAWRFFPGFTEATGGLPRERDLAVARDAFASSDGLRRWWLDRGLPAGDGLRLSIFCYPEAPIGRLLDALAGAGTPSIAVVPEPVADAQVEAWLSTHAVRIPDSGYWQAGTLTLARPALLPIDEYDRLLWSCDFNLVRGEDSWIRALWAGKPFVWQPYRQQDRAHEAKREAFLAWQRTMLTPCDDARAQALACLESLCRAWCDARDPTAAWQRVRDEMPRLAAAFATLALRASGEDDLSTRLVRFCRSRL